MVALAIRSEQKKSHNGPPSQITMLASSDVHCVASIRIASIRVALLRLALFGIVLHCLVLLCFALLCIAQRIAFHCSALLGIAL